MYIANRHTSNNNPFYIPPIPASITTYKHIRQNVHIFFPKLYQPTTNTQTVSLKQVYNLIIFFVVMAKLFLCSFGWCVGVAKTSA